MRRATFLTILAAASSTSAFGQDGPAREWSQPRGDAARTACIDVEPVRGQPEIAWRVELPGMPTSSPVVSSGTVFAVAGNAKGEFTLVAVRASTGERIATRPLGKAEWVDLAAVRGAVIAVDSNLARCFRFDGEKFSLGWNQKGAWAGQPAVSRGALFLPDASSVHVLDPLSGRPLLGSILASDSSETRDFAAMCVTDRNADAVLVSRLRWNSSVQSTAVAGLGTKKVIDASGDYVRSPYRVADTEADRRPRHATLTMLGRSWFATYVNGFYYEGDAHSSGSILLDRTETGRKFDVWHAPAIVERTAYAMTHDGATLSVQLDGSFSWLIANWARPKGARTCAASAARGVVYFGNWALEVASGRVLWCLPELEPVTTLVPAGDGIAVCIDAKGVLVGVAEPGRASAPQAGEPTRAGPAAPPALPSDADGALLADGRFVAGACIADASGRLAIATPSGEKLDLVPEEWALAQSAGKVVAVSEERVVLAALDEILDARSAAVWDAVFRKYIEVPLLADAVRALAAARLDGLSESRVRQLEQSLVGKRDHPNADMQRKRVGPEETAMRDACIEDVRTASRWCRARGLSGAAAAILSRIRRERPRDETAIALAREAIPACFPWAKAPDAADRWIGWAREIVPAGGEFVPADAPEAKKRRAAPWEEDVLLLRTRNVLLISRANDPAILGRCLRHAEGAVRACEQVLGPPAPDAPKERLEVRLHRDRKEYLSEEPPDGARAREWTSGYFSPSQRVSRFFVPSAEETAVTPLDRSLLGVLAHELTHHWVEMRWAVGNRSGYQTAGYWCVEGIADFVADQSVEMGRRQGRLDDATVESLDISSQLDERGGLFPLSTLLSMSHEAMNGLKDEPKTEVQMRYKARVSIVGPRSVFYAESAALTFWLLNRRGDEGRAAFIAYLRARYRAGPPENVAVALGFESPAHMQIEFRKFLASLRR